MHRLTNDKRGSGWKEIDAVTHRKQVSNRVVNEAFEPLRLNFDSSQRSALWKDTVRQYPPSFKLNECPAPQLFMGRVSCA